MKTTVFCVLSLLVAAGAWAQDVTIGGVAWAARNVGATSDSDPGAQFTWDEARKVCPRGWRLPTAAEFKTLRHKRVKSDWISFGGVQGMRFYRETLHPLFLPAAGSRDLGGTYCATPNGAYWAGNPTEFPDYGVILLFSSSGVAKGKPVAARDCKLSVRCVKE